MNPGHNQRPDVVQGLVSWAQVSLERVVTPIFSSGPKRPGPTPHGQTGLVTVSYNEHGVRRDCVFV